MDSSLLQRARAIREGIDRVVACLQEDMFSLKVSREQGRPPQPVLSPLPSGANSSAFSSARTRSQPMSPASLSTRQTGSQGLWLGPCSQM